MAEKTQSNDFDLTGKLLLAMPQMGDPRFHKSVVFLCAHDDKGAMGLVINNPLKDLKFSDLLDQLNLNSDIHIDLQKIIVMNGGPVDISRGFLLHGEDFKTEDTIGIGANYGVTGTTEAISDIAKGNGPDDLLFLLGYAGWSAGQLEQELRDNAWIVADPTHDIMFHNDMDTKWDMAYASLGFDPTQISAQSGRA